MSHSPKREGAGRPIPRSGTGEVGLRGIGTTKAGLAQRLRTARELAGLSQGQVARLMRLHRPTVSEIEAGRRRVSAEELASFAKHYGVTEYWLLHATGPGTVDKARIQLAARELEKLKPDDIKRVLDLLIAIQSPAEDEK